MKKITSLIATVLITSCILSGCAGSVLQEQDSGPSSSESQLPEQEESAEASFGSDVSLSKTQDNTTSSKQAAKEGAAAFRGQLTVELNFTRGATIASSQYAVWVENDAGQLVKTLYVSGFTAGGGYAFREDAVPTWVTKAKPDEMADAEIDAISGATPQSGIQRYTWDGTDETGAAVTDGTYHIYVEGTLYWSSTVLFSGDIEWGGSPQSITLTAAYTEENTTENRDMLTNVTAAYTV
ncbi:DUF2271 domain-containing protein [Lachnoclostridium pacaense]|nr:DUF2271 domain-containing protein [Lachnoclostridium pacaense]